MNNPSNDGQSTAATLPYRGDVGVQFSLVPAADRFIPIILTAIEGLDSIDGLGVSPDQVSTYLSGSAATVFGALTTTFVRAAQSGAHIVQPLLASRGGRGGDGPSAPAIGEDPDAAADRALKNFVAPAPSGVQTSAQFALMPMADANYTQIIASALKFVTALGLRVHTKDLVTRVDGDAALVLAAFAAVLTNFGAPDGHVVLNATLVANVPSGEAYA